MSGFNDAEQRMFYELTARHEPGLFEVTGRLLEAYIAFDDEVHRRLPLVKHEPEEVIAVQSLRRHLSDESYQKTLVGVNSDSEVYMSLPWSSRGKNVFVAHLRPRLAAGRHFDETVMPLIIARTLEDLTIDLRQSKAMATIKMY